MKRRFYQSKLAPMVWNPEKNCLLAQFKDGQFITEDDRVAERLIAQGYKEVTLKAKTPPELPEEPMVEVGDIPVMSGGMSEKVVLANLASSETDPGNVDTPPPPEEGDTPSSEVGNEDSKEDEDEGMDDGETGEGRVIKRRDRKE